MFLSATLPCRALDQNVTRLMTDGELRRLEVSQDLDRRRLTPAAAGAPASNKDLHRPLAPTTRTNPLEDILWLYGMIPCYRRIWPNPAGSKPMRTAP